MNKMLRAGVWFVICCAVPVGASAQMILHRTDDLPRAVTYLELGGNTMFFSGNVDVLVLPHVSVRLGAMLFPITDDQLPYSGLVMVNYLAGGHGHYLEVGGGILASHAWPQPYFRGTGPTVTLGYRYQGKQRVIRAGFTPALAPFKSQRPWDGGRWPAGLAVSVGRPLFSR